MREGEREREWPVADACLFFFFVCVWFDFIEVLNFIFLKK